MIHSTEQYMNETIKTIMERRSIRNFKQEQIENADVELIVEAGLRAANAMNRQTWHFTVVQNWRLLSELSQAVASVMAETGLPSLVERAESPAFSCFHHAPTVVFLSSDKTIYSIADCANAAQNMCVAAASLGLGSCYIASFAQAFKTEQGRKLLEAFHLPEGFEPVFSVALGYADGDLPSLKERERKIDYIR